jgi:hypothetical protein
MQPRSGEEKLLDELPFILRYPTSLDRRLETLNILTDLIVNVFVLLLMSWLKLVVS